MDSVVAEASSASKPSGATELSVSGATESSGCAMECIPSTESLRDDGSLWGDMGLPSGSKPSGANEPSVSGATELIAPAAMERGLSRRTNVSGKNLCTSVEKNPRLEASSRARQVHFAVEDWFEEMKDVTAGGVQLEEMGAGELFDHSLLHF